MFKLNYSLDQIEYKKLDMKCVKKTYTLVNDNFPPSDYFLGDRL